MKRQRFPEIQYVTCSGCNMKTRSDFTFCMNCNVIIPITGAQVERILTLERGDTPDPVLDPAQHVFDGGDEIC